MSVKYLRDHAADGCLLLGAVLTGIGVYLVHPVSTWFCAGGVCVVTGYLLARAERTL